MNLIVVKSQLDFNAVADQDVWTCIRIEALASERIAIYRVPKNCYIRCGDLSQPTIECGDSSQPTIECWASSQPTIECGDLSQPSIECWASSQPTIRCGDSSQPTIECWASSQPTIECWASSQPTIECGASSQPTIRCGDSSQPTIRCGASSQPTIECWEQTTLVMRGDKKAVSKHQQALVHYIAESNIRNFDNVKAWLKYWELKPKDGKVTLYKAVKPNFTDFYTGKIHYAVGSTVECPDWIENFPEECGHGFHCSPHLFLTERYVSGKHVHIAFEVDVADICLPLSGTLSMPDKVRVRKVQGIRHVSEKGLEVTQ